jgi:hypothetical protein
VGYPRDPTSAIPGTGPREEIQAKDRDSRTSGRKSGPIRLNQRYRGLLARPSHVLPSSEGRNEGSSGYSEFDGVSELLDFEELPKINEICRYEKPSV